MNNVERNKTDSEEDLSENPQKINGSLKDDNKAAINPSKEDKKSKPWEKENNSYKKKNKANFF